MAKVLKVGKDLIRKVWLHRRYRRQVTRAQTGDVAAFEQLLLRMHGPVRQYLNNLARAAAAEDILQEVAFKVLRKIKHLREPRVFMAWTFRIATRVAFDHLKKAKQWRELENDPEVARSLSTSFLPGWQACLER